MFFVRQQFAAGYYDSGWHHTLQMQAASESELERAMSVLQDKVLLQQPDACYPVHINPLSDLTPSRGLSLKRLL